MRIGNRLFRDGGLDHNNPSFAIYRHYTTRKRVMSTRPPTNTSARGYAVHRDLDFSRTRFTNIGTGARVEEVEMGKRQKLANYIPGLGAVLLGVFLMETLHEIAVNSGKTADIMRLFGEADPNFEFERFDATNKVSDIKLDDYHALNQIEERTMKYLRDPKTRKLLATVGSAIARIYLGQSSSPLQQNGSPTDKA